MDSYVEIYDYNGIKFYLPYTRDIQVDKRKKDLDSGDIESETELFSGGEK